MSIYYDDLLAAISRHLVGSFLQQIQLQMGAVCDGARLMPRFEDL
jgi:hypothetical protein